ncbi:hypothetical protein SRABI130_05148 [Pseudomonas sp. Bi130]|nr:hypothetical protein SRABI130_05148 [Pseudomonas sp. Bi130]
MAFVGEFSDLVGGVVDDVGVVAAAAAEGVGAGAAIQPVIAGPALQGVVVGVAEQGVVQVVADHGEVAEAGDGDIFDVLQVALTEIDGAAGQGRGVADVQQVVALVGGFLQQRQFAGLVEDIGVVAGAADQRVQPRATVEHVVAAVAGQHVVQGIADAGEVIAAGEGEVFQVGAQGPAHRGAYGVDFARQGTGLGDRVLEAVDDVGVVAEAAHHHVGAEATVQHVVAAVADQHVVQGVAGTGEVVVAGEGQVLEVAAQGVADRRHNRVDFAQRGAGFHHHVTHVIHNVNVVACTANHEVLAGTAIEEVGGGVAGEAVIEFVAGEVQRGGAEQHAVFDVGREGVAHRRADQVVAFVGEFSDLVGGVVDDVGVVAAAAAEGVGAGAAIQPVIAGPALQGVVVGVAEQGVVQVVADHGEVAEAGDGDIFDVLQVALTEVDGAAGQGRGVADVQQVVALVGGFLQQCQFAGLVEDIGVVAGAADQRIQPRATVEHVVATVAGQHVVQGIADAVEVVAASEGEVFQVGTQGPAHRGTHGVDFR